MVMGSIWDYVFDETIFPIVVALVAAFIANWLDQILLWLLRILLRLLPSLVRLLPSLVRWLQKQSFVRRIRKMMRNDWFKRVSKRVIYASIAGIIASIAIRGCDGIECLVPAPGSEVGWKTTVKLKSKAATEHVTLLVHPSSGDMYYRQNEPRPLAANTPESFEVHIGTGPGTEIGEEFVIILVCSDKFDLEKWSLTAKEVPWEQEEDFRIPVRKAAGEIRPVEADPADSRYARVKGNIWTAEGGALLLRKDGAFQVLEIFQPALKGRSFDEKFEIPPDERQNVYLLIAREYAPEIKANDVISHISKDSYWLYGPAKLAGTEEGRP